MEFWQTIKSSKFSVLYHKIFNIISWQISSFSYFLYCSVNCVDKGWWIITDFSYISLSQLFFSLLNVITQVQNYPCQPLIKTLWRTFSWVISFYNVLTLDIHCLCSTLTWRLREKRRCCFSVEYMWSFVSSLLEISSPLMSFKNFMTVIVRNKII